MSKRLHGITEKVTSRCCAHCLRSRFQQEDSLVHDKFHAVQQILVVSEHQQLLVSVLQHLLQVLLHRLDLQQQACVSPTSTSAVTH